MRLKKKVFFYLRGILENGLGGGKKYINFPQYLREKGVRVGENVNFRNPLNTLVDLTRPSLISIGDNVDINDHFSILTHDFGTYAIRGVYNEFINSSGKVTVGNNVVFGQNVTLLKGAQIGDNCIVGYGSVVTSIIPNNSVVVGSPARVFCSIEEYYQKRKRKQNREALEFGRSIITRFKRDPVIEDFTEEWCLFLTEDEFNNNATVRRYVTRRLNDSQIQQLFKAKKEYNGFEDFLRAIKNNNDEKSI